MQMGRRSRRSNGRGYRQGRSRQRPPRRAVRSAVPLSKSPTSRDGSAEKPQTSVAKLSRTTYRRWRGYRRFGSSPTFGEIVRRNLSITCADPAIAGRGVTALSHKCQRTVSKGTLIWLPKGMGVRHGPRLQARHDRVGPKPIPPQLKSHNHGAALIDLGIQSGDGVSFRSIRVGIHDRHISNKRRNVERAYHKLRQ